MTINDLTLRGAFNTISWDAVDGAQRYNIYKKTNGGDFGFIGSTTGTTFKDNNITENLSDSPPEAYNPFEGEGNYPRSVSIHEQRLVYASTDNDLQAVFLSRSGEFENLNRSSPAKADDSITFRIRSPARESIYSMLSSQAGLALFTSSTEWIVSGGDSEDYLTPTNPVARPQTRRGTYPLPPLIVGDVILYAQSRGGIIREFSYSFEDDTFNGPDRTILSRHLFEERRVVSWAYAQSPDSIIWVVLDNGDLLSMTYLREHDVWGWTPHETAGKVESVVSLPEGTENFIYITTLREIGGIETRFHERLTSRLDGFFVDCGLRHRGDPIQNVSGLWHLEGEAVSVLADGNVIEGLTVQDGGIDLGQAYSDIKVGLPYLAEIETLDLDLGIIKGTGTVTGRKVSLPKLTVHVENTAGIQAGYRRDRMNEWKQRGTEHYGESVNLFTGKFDMGFDPDYTESGNVIIQQNKPLAMTILAIAPDVRTGG